MDDRTLQHEIEALVAIEPAPEFRARLLQRIAEEPRLDGSRAVWRFSWKLATAAALVAATAIGVGLLRISPRPHATELAARSIEAVSYALPMALAGAERVPTPAPSGRPIAASRLHVTPKMLVIVDPAEVAAWHRLLASTGSGRVGITAQIQVPDESMQPLSVEMLPEGFVLPPVTIEPLTADFREQGVHP